MSEQQLDRAEVTDVLARILGTVKAVEKRGEERATKADEQGEQLGRLVKRLDSIEAKGMRIGEPGRSAGTLLLKSIIENESMKAFREGRTGGVSFEVPASIATVRKNLLTSLQNPFPGSPSSDTIDVAPQYGSQIQGFIQRPLTLLDVLPHIAVTSNLYKFPQLQYFGDNAAVQGGEGNAKAESGASTKMVGVAIATIAHYFPISKQVLDDAPSLSNFLTRLLQFGVSDKLERLLINGNGGSDEITGLYTESSAFIGGGGWGATKPADRIGTAIAYMKSIGLHPDCTVINDLDWFTITSERDANGRYTTTGWQTPTPQTIYGTTPVPSSSIAQGNALVIDSSQVAVLDRQTVRVEMGTTNDQFTRNLITMLAELRAGLAIFNTQAAFRVALT